MKNKALLLIFFTLLPVVLSFSFEVDETYEIRVPHKVIKIGDEIGLIFGDHYQIRNIRDFTLDADGWYTASFCGTNMHIIYGSNYFIYHSDVSDFIEDSYGGYNLGSSFLKAENFDEYIEYSFEWGHEECLWEDERGMEDYFFKDIREKIKYILVPDIRRETIGGMKILYTTRDMERFYTYNGWYGVQFYRYNAKPWATSKEPVGMTVKMNFYKPLDRIVILNGYVHPEKRYLYKQNRRMKKIRITNPDKTFEVVEEIEDMVHFHEIRLPEAVKTAEIEILEYYEGEKYKDLCVQMFGVRNYIDKRNFNKLSFSELDREDGDNRFYEEFGKQPQKVSR